MATLLDVNVLVAVLVPEHEHHALALEWFADRGRVHGWATCPITELGLVRVCAQLPGGAWPPARTCDQFLLLTATSRAYTFWPDTAPPSVIAEVREATTGRQITDRYLLSLARRQGGRLVTFDRALGTMGGADVLCLSPKT